MFNTLLDIMVCLLAMAAAGLCFSVRGWRRVVSAVLVALLAGLFLLGMAARSDPVTHTDDRLVILSPHRSEVRDEFARVFPQWYLKKTGRTVTLEFPNRGGTGDIVRYIQSTLAHGDEVDIDLSWGGGPDPYRTYAAAGLLSPVPVDPKILEGIPPRVGTVPVYDPGRMWYGTALSSFGIINNKKVFAAKLPGLTPPVSWSDLRNPALRGWIGSGDPSSSGSVRAAYEIMLQALGWQQGYAAVCEIAGNVRAFSEGGSSTPRMVADGVVATGMAIDLYAWEQIERTGAETCSFVLPAGQTVITPDPIAMFRGAPHPQAGRWFIAFVLSPVGQRIVALPKGAPGGPVYTTLYRMSVRRDIYASGEPITAAINPYTWKNGSGADALRYDHVKASRRNRILGDLLRASIIDVHMELKAAWKTVIDSGMNPELRRAFGRPPETEAHLFELAETVYANGTEAERAKLRADWTALAQARFRRIARGKP